MQLILTKWRPFSWHLYKSLNCDNWKIFVKIDEAMLNLGGSYSRRPISFIRKGHGDLSKLKCVTSDLFVPKLVNHLLYNCMKCSKIRNLYNFAQVSCFVHSENRIVRCISTLNLLLQDNSF